MILDFEIAVDQHTKVHDRPFEEGGQNSEICRAFFIIWPANFFEGLIQNSTPKRNVEIQFNVHLEFS